MERRNQLLVRALAARNPDSRFLFCEQPLRAGEYRRWKLPCLRQILPNVWAFRPIRPVPDSRARTVADRAEALQINRAARRLGLHEPLVWTQDPRASTLLDQLRCEGLVYDLTDDWAAFESEPARRMQMQAAIESLGRRAQVVFACSRALEEGARPWAPGVRYLPNAVESPGPPQPQPGDLLNIPRPRLGYAGTLHSSRIDVDLLVATASARPEWSIVLIGPQLLTAADTEQLRGLDNVHLLGIRPHHAVRGYLEHIDVCLLPNLVTEFTRSLDPLKLYEYFAAGRPVVSTPVDNAPELADLMAIASTAEDFVVEAEKAMELDGPEAIARRRGRVADATWEARANEVEAALSVVPTEITDEISVVIVSFNTCALLARCLTALEAQSGVTLQVVVVDNASTDGSPQMVRERFPEVELIPLAENVGFGPANNIAFGQCRGEHVLLLNSDAFVAPGAVATLAETMRRRPDAAVIGPRLLNEDGSLQRSAWPFPRAWRLLLEAIGMHRLLRRTPLLEDLGTWDHGQEREVDFLVGACLLARRDVLEAVGGFDERFWLYGEEADLQQRMVCRGWTVVFTPAAEVTHVAGASSSAPTRRLRHFYRGQLRFVRKHEGPVAYWVARLALVVQAVLRRRWMVLRVAVSPLF